MCTFWGSGTGMEKQCITEFALLLCASVCSGVQASERFSMYETGLGNIGMTQ